jgi:sugar phosphate isomerase/epimerase
MRLALCNEVVRELPFERQCALAADLGYHGLEIAPFTLGEAAYRMPSAERARLRRACADAGIAVSGLHWLLVAPPGLSITTSDSAVWDRTVDVMRRLVGLCADLGGTYLVHGSPEQRRLDEDPAAAGRGEEAWAAVASESQAAGVTYCIEPLAPALTPFVTTVAEAAAIVGRVNSPALKTMIDTSAAAGGEAEPVSAVFERWLPSGHIAHVHFNDRNRRGPGQGEDAFGPVLASLERHAYGGWIGIEPFEYIPDGPTCAARSIGYVQGLIEALSGSASDRTGTMPNR